MTTVDTEHLPEHDTELCKRYNFSVKELNEEINVWEKILLVRDLPEPNSWKKEKKKTVSVSAMVDMMKDSPLIKMVQNMHKPKSELMDV